MTWSKFKLQAEVDRLTREKLKDRLRIMSLEQTIAKENLSSVNTIVESTKFLLESVTTHALPALTTLSSTLVNVARGLILGRKRKRRRVTSQLGSEQFL